MNFKLREYIAPVFSEEKFKIAQNAVLEEAPIDGVAPEHYHAMSIYPEYFKIDGKWHLAEESRMDCVAVWDGCKVKVVEFRNLKKGDLVVVGRTEDASEGIYLYPDGFNESEEISDKLLIVSALA